jgi:protein-L-isoaspartate(D-aspartate) O-methyltransferase
MRGHERQEMLRTIEEEFRLTRNLTGREKPSPAVLDAMRCVPREEFVPESLRREAFANGPLPIGEGQTISQPFIVALMTDLLEPRAGQTVLEVGAGSGYQAAILSLLVAQVYSLEIVPLLAERAASRLERLGYGNVVVRHGDGYQGWAEHAPYDGIIVTAAAPFVPPALVDQLRPGGRLVVPVGLPYHHQELLLVEKDADGQRRTTSILGVAFVPMVQSS